MLCLQYRLIPGVSEEATLQASRESGTQTLGIVDNAVVEKPRVGIEYGHLGAGFFDHFGMTVAN